MLRKRVIPCLLIKNKGLVKTVKFSKDVYIGDPINAVRIFNDKEVDELIILDILATQEHRSPDLRMIENIASECFMPVCYGGGIHSVLDIRNVLKAGIEKVSLNSASLNNPGIITQAASIFGSQAIVVTIDIKKDFFGKQKVFTHRGRKNTGKEPVEFAREIEKLGAGEIVIQNIDRDGMMSGYDIALMKKISESVSVPVTALGGCGSLETIKEITQQTKVSAVAAGSLFVYHGKNKGILINYPTYEELSQVI